MEKEKNDMESEQMVIYLTFDLPLNPQRPYVTAPFLATWWKAKELIESAVSKPEQLEVVGVVRV